jgi:hypothetical protein
MTDRELLEAAAKAAGLVVLWDHYAGVWDHHADVSEQGAMVTADGYAWNPLEDEGDALRLAVKLEISITLNEPIEISTSTCMGYTEGEYAMGVEAWRVLPGHTVAAQEIYGDDKGSVIRRAIVRAAAEMATHRPGQTTD